MLTKLFQKMRGMVDEPDPFDHSRFGDPVAEQTSWTPAKRGGANFRTRKLIMVTPNRIEFRASLAAKIFFSSFLLGGMGFAVGVYLSHFSTGAFPFDPDMLVPLFAGIGFGLLGGFCCILVLRPLFLTKVGDFSARGERLEMAC